MMKTLLLGLICFLLTSCQKSNVKFPEWGSSGDVGFAMNINQLAGGKAINCGFFELLHRSKPTNYSDGFQCAMKAYKKGLPFKLGTLTIPIDSYSYEAFLYSEGGRFLEVNFDAQEGFNGNHYLLWTNQCEAFEFDSNKKQILGINCEKISEYSW